MKVKKVSDINVSKLHEWRFNLRKKRMYNRYIRKFNKALKKTVKAKNTHISEYELRKNSITVSGWRLMAEEMGEMEARNEIKHMYELRHVGFGTYFIVDYRKGGK